MINGKNVAFRDRIKKKEEESNKLAERNLFDDNTINK
jgi:hypothetical protein